MTEIIEIATHETLAIEVPASDEQVVVMPTAVSLEFVDVAEQGPAGPPGLQGERGYQGTPGISGASFVHDQGVPASLWNVAHGLGRFPSVTVVDSTGSEVEGDTRYLDADTIQLIFSAAFAGKAYIN